MVVLNGENWLTGKELCEKMQITYRQLVHLRDKGIPKSSERVGREYVYNERLVNEWLKGR